MKTRALPGDLVAEAPVRAGFFFCRARVARGVAAEAGFAISIDADGHAVRERHHPRYIRMLRLELDGNDRRRVVFVVARLQGSRVIIAGRVLDRNTQRSYRSERFESFLDLNSRRIKR